MPHIKLSKRWRVSEAGPQALAVLGLGKTRLKFKNLIGVKGCVGDAGHPQFLLEPLLLRGPHLLLELDKLLKLRLQQLRMPQPAQQGRYGASNHMYGVGQPSSPQRQGGTMNQTTVATQRNSFHLSR